MLTRICACELGAESPEQPGGRRSLALTEESQLLKVTELGFDPSSSLFIPMVQMVHEVHICSVNSKIERGVACPMSPGMFFLDLLKSPTARLVAD